MRSALRRLARQPLYAATHVGLIALALLIATATASLVDSLLLRPLPFHRPSELAAMGNPSTIDGRLTPAELDIETARVATSPLIVQRATVRWGFMTELQGPAPGQIDLVHYEVSDDFWNLLGVRPHAGRLFAGAEASGDVPPAILGDALWRVHFEGRQVSLGDVVVVNGFKVRLVGVMPRDFAFPVGANIWTPLKTVPRRPPSFVRIRPGASIAQLAAEFPRLDVYAIDRLVRPEGRIGLFLIGVASLLVLVIAVVQVASVCLSNAVAQSTQIWIRKALGASDRRLVMERLQEALWVTATATGVAWLMLPGVLHALEVTLPREVTRGQVLMADARIFLMSALCALGVVITIAVLARHLAGCVKVSGAQATVIGLRQTRRITGRILVVQFACTAALVYLCGMGLQTFRNVSSADLGFDPNPLLIARVSAMPSAALGAFEGVADRIQARLVADESVSGLARASTFPFAAGAFTGTALLPQVPAFEPMTARVTFASIDYFRVLGARFVEGKGFPDRYDSRAVVINETLARYLRQRGPVLGQFLQVTSFRGPVLGVVADIVDRSPDVPREPHAYFMDPGWAAQTFIVRVAAGSTVTAIASRVADVVKQESGVADVSVAPMRDYARRATAPQQTRLLILLGLSVAGVGLAGTGVMASLLMTVRQRRQEIGLLFALGADVGDVRRIITRACARAATAGTVCGLLVAGGLAHLLRSIFFGVAPISIFSIGFTLVALVAVAVIAAIGPVTVAARIAPGQALRR